MSDIQNWLLNPPKWSTKHFDLMRCKTYVKKSVNLDEVIQNCDNIPVKPEYNSTCCKSLLDVVPKDVLERNIQSAYPVMHEAALHLCAEFLLTKLNHGSSIEKRLYENMSLLEFIQRLLEKRAGYFVNPNDNYYKLRDGTSAADDHGPWDNIGTEKETKPLVLEDYLSYDELKLSAFLSFSSYSYFINSGRRFNSGNRDPRILVQDEGVVIGLIGPRLNEDKMESMESQEILIERKSIFQTILSYFNFKKPSAVLDLFLNFYEEKTHVLEDTQRYVDLPDGKFFDKTMYSKRLAVSFDTLLIEANHRAQESGKSAFVHVVHIDLFLSDMCTHQTKCFLDTFGQRLKALGKNLKFISDVEFSYFDTTCCCLGYGDGSIFPIENHPKEGINIHFTRRPPFGKLDNKDALLVVSYAADSNSMPGRECWLTGDFYDMPTVSACQLAELHNPYINPFVVGENLRVATPTGLVHVQEYLQNALDNLSQQ